MSANAIDLFAGVNVPPPTADGQILNATGAGAARWSNVIDAGGLTVTSGNITANLGNFSAPLGGVSGITGTFTGAVSGTSITGSAGISGTTGTYSGVIAANAGTNSSGSAPVIAAPGFANGTASQLSDLTRDYIVYITVTAAGTVFIIAIGPTVGVANTIVPSSSVSLGESFAIRLPAGWFLKWSATTTTISQIAVGC